MNLQVYEALMGKTINKIDRTTIDANDTLLFHLSDGTIWEMTHYQDCCEKVWLESIDGDINDLVGSPILMAEETTSTGCDSSTMWTFYKFATNKGYVTLRWCGESDYYSISVSFEPQS